MNFLIFCLFLIIGMFVTLFTVIQILIILRFGIPLTKKLESMNLMTRKNGLISPYGMSLIVISIMYFVILKLIETYVPAGFNGFLLGAVLAILTSFDKTGRNADNFWDFIQTNEKSFTVSKDEIITMFNEGKI